MTLSFPNDSRSFDAARNSVSFWGYDASFEVAFRLDESALHRLAGKDRLSETAALAVFDNHLAHIRTVATRMYRKRQKRYCELSGSDM